MAETTITDDIEFHKVNLQNEKGVWESQEGMPSNANVCTDSINQGHTYLSHRTLSQSQWCQIDTILHVYLYAHNT